MVPTGVLVVEKVDREESGSCDYYTEVTTGGKEDIVFEVTFELELVF